MLLLVTVTPAHAFLTDCDSQANSLSVGYATTSLNEVFESPESIEAGMVIPKEVTVTNTGNCPVFVRVFLEVSDPVMRKLTSLNINQDFWTKNPNDGRYYYVKPLAPGQTTEPLMTKVSISNGASQDDLRGFQVIVQEESIQAKDHSSWQEAYTALHTS